MCCPSMVVCTKDFFASRTKDKETPMAPSFEITDGFVADQNKKAKAALDEDFEHLGRVLRRRGVEIEALVTKAQAFKVALPSWGVGTGGTRFARFAGIGEPRGIYEKLEDCGTVN